MTTPFLMIRHVQCS